jgi:translation elongation factor P/translation initiation factor 5A
MTKKPLKRSVALKLSDFESCDINSFAVDRTGRQDEIQRIRLSINKNGNVYELTFISDSISRYFLLKKLSLKLDYP